MFLIAISLTMPSFITATDSDTKKESTTKKIVTGAVRLPFEIGKNLSAGLMIVGAGATAVCAYLWLVKGVNAGGFNIAALNLAQHIIERSPNPGPREQIEWLKIQLYKNIDVATLASGASTAVAGFAYLLFKSFADTLK